MSLLRVNQISKFVGASCLFAAVSFQVDEHDRLGLVGPNGSGKSTLLQLLAGLQEPDRGTILAARDLRIGYLSQTLDLHADLTLREEMLLAFAPLRSWEEELRALAAEIATATAQGDDRRRERLLQHYAEVQLRFEHAGGYTYEQRVQQVLDGLGFSRALQESPIAHLSGGQQRRAALGKLLLQEPDLLLLDEPTNHLDLAALEWLESYLQEWPGALLVVEHDRYFLDAVTSRIMELAFGTLEEYPGNYTRYLQLREERYARRLREYEEQQEYIQRTEAFIRRYRAGQRSRQARGRAKLLSRLERLDRPQDLQRMRLELKPLVESGRTVLTTEGLVAGYAAASPDGSPNALVRVPNLEIRRGERIGLLGPNGSGKTTLLRTLIGQLPPLRGKVLPGHQVRIGYYSQTHEDLHPERTLLDAIREVAALSEEAARDLLARFLFEGDDVWKPIASLSGGERSRLILARLALQGPNLLVLDEPTNHLDLPARQLLEEVLSAFSGTLLFVSHDRYLIDRLATRLWVIEDGTLTIRDGNYTAYRLARRYRPAAAANGAGSTTTAAVSDAQQPGHTPAASPAGEQGRTARARRPRKSTPQARRLAQVEQEIEREEERLRELEEALNAAAFRSDAPALQRLAEDYEALKTRLAALFEEWERLAEATDADL